MSKNKNKQSVSVTFISEVDSFTDTAQLRAAYKDLSKQIQSFAESLATDQNIIISHSKLNGMGEVAGTVDAKIAELQTINTKIAKGQSSITDPSYKSKFEPKVKEVKPEAAEEDDNDPPRVRAVAWTPPQKNIPAPITAAAPVTKVVDATLKGKMEVTIFSSLKKTEKSSAIVGYFLSNPDKNLTVDEIAKGAKLDNKAVSIWLATTAKESVKAIKNVGRGTWFFDSSKVKVY